MKKHNITLAEFLGWEDGARIKGAELINKEYIYWNWDSNQEGLFVGGKCQLSELLTMFTKEEWESIRINDTNADFEEAQDDN